MDRLELLARARSVTLEISSGEISRVPASQELVSSLDHLGPERTRVCRPFFLSVAQTLGLVAFFSPHQKKDYFVEKKGYKVGKRGYIEFIDGAEHADGTRSLT
jgi:hypothetical protein